MGVTKRDSEEILLVVLCFFFPPLAVYLVGGSLNQILLNVLLWILAFGFPAVIHALILVMHKEKHIKPFQPQEEAFISGRSAYKNLDKKHASRLTNLKTKRALLAEKPDQSLKIDKTGVSVVQTPTTYRAPTEPLPPNPTTSSETSERALIINKTGATVVENQTPKRALTQVLPEPEPEATAAKVTVSLASKYFSLPCN